PCLGDDQWCVMAVFTEEEWQSLYMAMGTPEWGRDERFATLEARKTHEDELDPLVAAWTIRHTAGEAMRQLQAVGVAAGMVQSTCDVIDRDPQIRHRDYFPRREHPEIGWCNHYGWPIKLSKTKADIRTAPLFGEANEYVCKQLLGMSGEQFLGLQASGAFD
ncbi:MAG: CoA transferase, partial [Dehalococcoidia bacterium]